MAFRWLEFCKRYGIEYVTEGPNVARGNINIKCPLCSNDPSHHMGLSLDKPWWACWRDRTHRGGKPNFLIRTLLNTSREQTQEIIADFGGGSLEETTELLADMHEGIKRRKALHRLPMPEEFVALDATKFGARARPFRDYMVSRGFPESDHHRLAELYDLRICTMGEYHDRLILPVYYQGLATWTGRSIFKDAKTRYKTLSTDKDKAAPYTPARYAVTDLLYNFEQLRQSGGDKLFIVEGPFDALKLDFYGRTHGGRATCLFGLSVSPMQQRLLAELSEVYDKMFLVLDPGAFSQQVGMMSALPGVKQKFLPDVYKDPGEMPKAVIKDFIRAI